MRKALIAAVVFVLGSAVPAFAHVEVSPGEVAKGATATFTFKAEDEEDAANTNAIEILWPDDVSFTTVSPAAKSGWTATPSARSMKWSGGAITGHDDSFTVTLGPVPNTETIVFKVIQTYDNGTIARWIGAAGTDNPAPFVTLTGAPVTTTTVATIPPTTVATLKAEEKKDGGNAVTFLIAGAMLLAGVGGGIVVAARRRSAES